MWALLGFLIFARAYQEILSIIPIDAYNTLSILNFSDSISINRNAFQDIGSFPLPIIEVLEESQYFTATLTSGIIEGAIPRILDFQIAAGKYVNLGQPGLTIFAKTDNWSAFTNKLNTLTGTYILPKFGPLPITDMLYWHTNDYLCVENLYKIANWLPCKNDGIASLFEQLLLSKYLSIRIEGHRIENNYSYSLVISSIRKDQISGTLSTCISSGIEIFESAIETYNTPVKIGKLTLSPVKSSTSPDFTSKRHIVDDERGFTADFFHILTNNLPESIHLTVYEYFPKPAIPLLSLTSHKIAHMFNFDHGWMLVLNIDIPPGETTIKIGLQKILLSFEEYPNDPQRGWEVPSMPIFYNDKIIQSNGLLMIIPEPDFSMPFNVICITGTVLAFFFTSIQSLQTWKDSVHWSNDSYETSILKAKKVMNILKNIFLVITLIILWILDRNGIIKMFG
ncbi:hypothetical protein SteCoe_38666 [Stentor coeruleus]|uniref:GPI transamidase component PIG-T n=1 Tax=Stentor coeruleus TaxID=5963 RepID=A0A1R2AL71_9CILI|nr:hypothetical protein SteCoe_38666 [Stentor coeruleus]